MSKVREALRIDFSKRRSLEERWLEKRNELLRDKTAKSETPLCVQREDSSSIQKEDKQLASRELRMTFMLELCPSQLICGQSTVDAEERAMNASMALGLANSSTSTPLFDLGPRILLASFPDSHETNECDPETNNEMGCRFSTPMAYIMGTKRDIHLWKLRDVTSLAIMVAKKGQEHRSKADILAYRSLLQEIVDAPSPYGWLIRDSMNVLLSGLAAVAAYFGSWKDVVICLIIGLAVLGVQKLKDYPPCRAVLAPLETIIVSAVIGLMTAGAYRFAPNEEYFHVCNIPIVYLSPLLVYLPGSELIYGAYETLMGHMVVGGARLVATFVKCMVLALGLTIGWQFTGYNLMQDENIEGGIPASFVPTKECKPFAEDWNVGPWYVVFAGWNLVFLIPTLVGLQVHPRDFLSHATITYVSLLVFGALNFAGQQATGSIGLSVSLVNIIGMFVAANFGCMYEYLTGMPAVTSIIPVLLTLAPGSPVVLNILALMQVEAGVPDAKLPSVDAVTYLWLLGVSYALGLYMALALWKPLLVPKEVAPELQELVHSYRRRNAIFDAKVTH